jgi:uncharacterized protein YihD (DUF1040 family)
MRDPKRIPKLLDLIKKLWEKNPDLRLLQMLGNLFNSGFDPYYTEDDILYKKLIQMYGDPDLKDKNN